MECLLESSWIGAALGRSQGPAYGCNARDTEFINDMRIHGARIRDPGSLFELLVSYCTSMVALLTGPGGMHANWRVDVVFDWLLGYAMVCICVRLCRYCCTQSRGVRDGRKGGRGERRRVTCSDRGNVIVAQQPCMVSAFIVTFKLLL